MQVDNILLIYGTTIGNLVETLQIINIRMYNQWSNVMLLCLNKYIYFFLMKRIFTNSKFT